MNRLYSIMLLIAILLSALIPSPVLAAPRLSGTYQDSEISCMQATIHYKRSGTDYDDWGLHVWGPTSVTGVTWTEPFLPTAADDYGLIWIVDMAEGAEFLNYIVHKGDEKDPGPDQTMKFSKGGCEIWLMQGNEVQYASPEDALASVEVVISQISAIGADQVIIHYMRANSDYEGWGLHIWGPTAVSDVTWGSPLLPAGQDEYGIYWIIDIQPGADLLNYIVHLGDVKDPGPDQTLQFSIKGREIWLIEGSAQQFTTPEQAFDAFKSARLGDIQNKAQAYWLSRTFIAWPIDFNANAIYSLHYAPEGNLKITDSGLQGGNSIPLQFVGSVMRPELAERFPHLRGASMLKISDEYLPLLPEILKAQIAVSSSLADGSPQGASALQIAGVLDDLYAEAAETKTLGVSWQKDIPTLRLWAPTARGVSLLLFDTADSSQGDNFPLDWDPATGIWSITGTPEWKNKYYLYDIDVFIRQESSFVNNQVTDPYSFSLSTNSARSQIVDLHDPALMPTGWDTLEKPHLEYLTDIVLYELHLRDFSIIDEGVPAEQRGTFMAFTNTNSDGMQHLSRLAEGGITHVHMLPLFDIATINEDKSQWDAANFDKLETYPPDSDLQQADVNATRTTDGFNWGYDPLHYTVPEGSYSTNPDGSTRILEFRHMVQALNQINLRVVMDVVYNHTNAAGQNKLSVLDRIVPGYYHRLDANGNVTSSTCCANTASEHAMMSKLMIDSVLTWATAYKVDGFRFDLMGHHMKDDMLALRNALDKLSIQNDGIEGQMIYVYGEGWDFGEVANNARGINATQENLGGTGIGVFNDRIRDALRGGNPFGGQQEQGFATGLFTNPNEVDSRTPDEQLKKLLDLSDQVRVSLAGNLAAYEFIDAQGYLINGSQVDYNGSPAGYTKSPVENIIYVSAHDNETLFDAVQYKAPLSTTMAERVQMQNMALSVVALSQGVPFYHAGSELLRSKSLDRDSYDSGDWFNAIDWSYQNNGWGHGLPIEDKNGTQWPVIGDLLRREELTPSRTDILTTLNHFEIVLQIRKSSPLFRLQTAEQIQRMLSFHNTGPEQIPGLIVMSLSDDADQRVDPKYDLIVVLFNATPDDVSFSMDQFNTGEIVLHPALQQTLDANYIGGLFSLPKMSTAVFVREAPTVISESVSPEIAPETPYSPSSQDETSVPSWIFIIGGIVLIGLGIWIQLRKSRKHN
ncbi:MAG: pullulanase-type alpha-1,6-glucosidase [Chloroflexi bacterium]|nr:pullulanase-type alpha-1,6-glucosidase [Chloroflexota bacterium]